MSQAMAMHPGVQDSAATQSTASLPAQSLAADRVQRGPRLRVSAKARVCLEYCFLFARHAGLAPDRRQDPHVHFSGYLHLSAGQPAWVADHPAREPVRRWLLPLANRFK